MEFMDFYYITLGVSLSFLILIFFRKGYSQDDDLADIMVTSAMCSLIPLLNLLIIGVVIFEEFKILQNKTINKRKKESEINEFWECVMCDIRMRKGYILKSKVENQCPICKRKSTFLKVEKKVIASDKIIEHQYIKLKDFEKDTLVTDIEEQEAKYLEIMKNKLTENKGE